MKNGYKATVFAGLSLLAVSALSFSACSAPASPDEGRIAQLETDLKSQTAAVADLQQKVDQLKTRVDALTPVQQAPAPPPAPPPVSPPPTSNATAGPKPLSATSVSIDRLTVSPEQVNLGQVVTITVDVKNKGTVDGVYKVVVTEKKITIPATTNMIEYTDTVTLKAGETRTLSFTTSQNVVGVFQVDSGTKSATYTVNDPNAPSGS